MHYGLRLRKYDVVLRQKVQKLYKKFLMTAYTFLEPTRDAQIKGLSQIIFNSRA